MPSNWLYIDTNFPAFTREESTEEKVVVIQNYLFMLVEQLRYSLHNLDLSNMNKTAVGQFVESVQSPVYKEMEATEGSVLKHLQETEKGLLSRIEDAEGKVSEFEQTADGFRIQVKSYEETVGGYIEQYSEWTQTVSGFTSTVESYEETVGGYSKQYSSWQQTVEGFTSQVESYEQTQDGYSKQYSSWEQTVSGFTSTVESYEETVGGYTKQYSSWEQTVTGFNTTVQNYETDVNGYKEQVSRFQQTVSGFNTTVQNYETDVNGYKEQVSRFQQTVSGFNTTVQNYETDVNGYKEQVSRFQQTVTGFSLSVTNGNTSSTIKLMSNGAEISSQNITFNGMVTFNALNAAPGEGATKIHGGWIQTNTLVVGSIFNFDTEVGNKITGTVTEDYIFEKGALTKTALSTAPTATATTLIHGGWIQTKTITANQIASSTITADQIASRTITATELASDAIRARHIKANTITGDKLVADTVIAGNLIGEAVALYSDEVDDDEENCVAGIMSITGADSSDFAVDLTSYGALRFVAEEGALYLEAGGEYLTIEEVRGEGYAVVVSNTFMPYTDEEVNLGNYLYYWNEAYISQCYGYTEAASTSDRNKKNSISYDLSRYDSFFDCLQPAIYKLNDGTSDRYHVGLIAQDVEVALAENEIPTSDFGGFIKMYDSYALRYGEFIGLLIWQVQMLKKEVMTLKAKVAT